MLFLLPSLVPEQWQRMWVVAAMESSSLGFPEGLLLRLVFQVNMRELEVGERDRKVMGGGKRICVKKSL